MNTRSAMASLRVHTQNERIKRVVENTVNELTDHPKQSVRVTTKVAQWVLIRHPKLISCSKTYSTQVRNIGTGIKELYLKEIYASDPQT